MVQARLATPLDAPDLGVGLAAAFATDPLWRWMVPDEQRWSRRAAAMFAHEASGRIRYGHTYTTDDCAGAALWAPPGFWRGTRMEMLRSAPPMVRLLGRAGGRAGVRVLRAIEGAHPRGDHWYLAVLGTRPSRQGQGVGSAVLRPVLERCDLDGTGAYLESSNPANIAFYERHHFRATGALTPAGSPPLTTMWRDPQPLEAGPR